MPEARMDQAIDQGVGGEIKRLRSERDWSMAKLAVEADMSVSGVSMIENGKRNLTTTTLAKLARAFDVEVVDLFPKTESRSSLEPSFNDVLEGERRESVYGPWLDLANRYADRWERQLETGDFDLGRINEFVDVVGEIVPVLRELNTRELEEFPVEGSDTFGGHEALTGQAIWRILDLLQPLVNASHTKFANSDLEQLRRKRESLEQWGHAASG
jgi:transcriptional regulator with XRE-family HTH domain